ncbi:hypothetical protein KY360_05215 [Candidatus Woesearchaeota archaeon]|nr:hypothetical protein [Candidatus Woesearchaeota archaeon]
MAGTFVEAKSFVENPHYQKKKDEALHKLDYDEIDPPITDIIKGFTTIPYCFLLQSCYGHFVHEGQKDPKNVSPLSNYNEDSKIEYRIAYIAIVIENNDKGKKLYQDLEAIVKIDPENIQFGSVDWFWNKGDINSYVLQVEPDRYKAEDGAIISVDEALHLQNVRDKMFEALRKVLRKHKQMVE